MLADLRDTMALRGEPTEVRVSRWMGSFPQYRPGHLDRVGAIEADLAAAQAWRSPVPPSAASVCPPASARAPPLPGRSWRLWHDRPPRHRRAHHHGPRSRRAALYRDAFGLDLHVGDHEGDDPWTSGRHAATSWTDGAFLHFAIYESTGAPSTTRAQIAFDVDDLVSAHERAVAAGAEVLHSPKPQPWGSSARYADHDGNTIELTQRT